MNHPTCEQWTSYLYDETTGEEHANLAAHLAVCPACKTVVDEWRSARANLDAWQLPSPRPRFAPARPWIRWAAAAAVMLGAGFGIGRLASSPLTADAVRAEIEPKIRQELRQEFARTLRAELERTTAATLAASSEESKQLLSDYDKALDTKREGENRAIYAALNRLESQRLSDFVSLKKDLDTVAVLTDARLRRTQQQLVQLADYSQPAPDSNSPQN